MLELFGSLLILTQSVAETQIGGNLNEGKEPFFNCIQIGTCREGTAFYSLIQIVVDPSGPLDSDHRIRKFTLGAAIVIRRFVEQRAPQACLGNRPARKVANGWNDVYLTADAFGDARQQSRSHHQAGNMKKHAPTCLNRM